MNFSSVEEIGGSWEAVVVILSPPNATNRARCHGEEGRRKEAKTSHDDCKTGWKQERIKK